MNRLSLVALSIWLAGCANQSTSVPLPDVPTASAYQGATPAANAAPAITADDWWVRFQDPELDALQQRLMLNSPDLASALARYDQAQAATDVVRASQSVTGDVQLNTQRNRQSANRPLRGADSPDDYNSGTLGLNLSYEVDLWGRIRQQVEASVADEQAAQADLANARLALQARLADTLLALRGADQQVALLRDAEVAYQRAVQMIEQRRQNGIASGLDLARAQTQLATIRAQIPQMLAQRATYEHAIAVLVGANASTFHLEAKAVSQEIPQVPSGLPSTLLQRRPDIARAQQRVASANASVGVARTAFYPSLTLSAVGGFQSSDLDHIVNASNLFWSIGPGLLVNLLDGGRHEAQVQRANAVLDEAGHQYRSVVLNAFKEVEDQLTVLDRYAAAATEEQVAVDSAGRALAMATDRYREGAVSYLEVVSTQTTALDAQRSAEDLSTRQKRATVQLVRALGGGWSGQLVAGNK